MRLDRFLANSGVGTRNENKDIVKYEDKVISYKPFVYVMINKPDGVISATEDREHKTVIELLGNDYRTYSMFPVGRLDIDTEGLLILTNDGMLTHNLLAPNKHVNKKYYVELKNPVSQSDIEKLEKGIELENGFITKDAKIEVIENADIPINKKTGERTVSKAYITITEGKYHQVKRMFKALDNKVIYLKRIQMGKLKLDEKLKTGEYRELTENEIKILKNN